MIDSEKRLIRMTDCQICGKKKVRVIYAPGFGPLNGFFREGS